MTAEESDNNNGWSVDASRFIPLAVHYKHWLMLNKALRRVVVPEEDFFSPHHLCLVAHRPPS